MTRCDALTTGLNDSISGWCVVAEQLKKADVCFINIVTLSAPAKTNESLFIQITKPYVS